MGEAKLRFIRSRGIQGEQYRRCGSGHRSHAAHPDLAAKILPGYNAVDGSNNSADINGHGTAVAGTAAAQTNNTTGVAGVAWNAAILPVRVSNSSDGYAYWSDVARGLNWAANHNVLGIRQHISLGARAILLEALDAEEKTK